MSACAGLPACPRLLTQSLGTRLRLVAIAVDRLFEETSIILFLNKRDLYERKIKKVDIRQPPSEDYPEGLFTDYECACCAAQQLLLSLLLTDARALQPAFARAATATPRTGSASAACSARARSTC